MTELTCHDCVYHIANDDDTIVYCLLQRELVAHPCEYLYVDDDVLEET